MATSYMDTHYDRDYRKGLEGGRDENVSLSTLKERYNYLAKGGMWDRSEEEDKYLAGFRDAMKTLRVVK